MPSHSVSSGSRVYQMRSVVLIPSLAKGKPEHSAVCLSVTILRKE